MLRPWRPRKFVAGGASFKVHCASCHGGDLRAGSTGPSILGHVQYHTDAEVSVRIRSRKAHTEVHLNDVELRQVLANLRILAGTNRDMATGGYPGARKSVWGKSGRAEPAENNSTAPRPDGSGKDAFLKVCSGCHTTQVVTGRGDTKDGWKRLGTNMVERGARGTNDELASIVGYLPTNFPPKSETTGPAQALGAGKVSGTARLPTSFR